MRVTRGQPLLATTLALFSACCAAGRPAHAAQEDFVDLRGQQSLSDAEARSLAERAGVALFLNDVTEISDEAIDALAAREGPLILSPLSRICG